MSNTQTTVEINTGSDSDSDSSGNSNSRLIQRHKSTTAPHDTITPTTSHPTGGKPLFRIPTDLGKRYELWTVRIPRGMDLDALDGCLLSIPNGMNDDCEFVTQKDGQSYSFQWGDPSETENFRILLPKRRNNNNDDDNNNEDDDEDDEEDEEDEDNRYWYPLRQGFQRHVHIVSSIPGTDDLQVAPDPHHAPTPVETVRHAYKPIPQVKGLRRRFTPLGAGRMTQSIVPSPLSLPRPDRSKGDRDDNRGSESTTMTTSRILGKRSGAMKLEDEEQQKEVRDERMESPAKTVKIEESHDTFQEKDTALSLRASHNGNNKPKSKSKKEKKKDKKKKKDKEYSR